jgi:hypothetical protein
MYCAACGSTLPIEAQFCPQCGKRNVLDEVTSDIAISEAPAKTEIETRGIGDIPEPEQNPQTEANSAPPASETNTTINTVPQAVPAEPAAENSKVTNNFLNVGSITLGVVALICLVLGAVQGFIPIFLIEGVAFAALAWLCAARWPFSPRVFSAVFVTSLLLAGLVGVTLDQDTFGPRYRYLSQGSVQYRVDEKAGRTDRLRSGGWLPVAFDKEATEVPIIPELTKGSWSSSFGYGTGKVCFRIDINPFAKYLSYGNPSEYIIDRITITAQIQSKNGSVPGNTGSTSSDPNGPVVSENEITLKGDGGGFINSEEATEVCGSSPRDLADGETWSYTDMHVYGWKR